MISAVPINSQKLFITRPAGTADRSSCSQPLLTRTPPAGQTWCCRTTLLVVKDGAAVSAAESRDLPARVQIAVGETYDFEYDAPSARGRLWLEVRTTSGKWQAQGHVAVR